MLTVKSGQYDDLDGVAFCILMDDDPRTPRNQSNQLVGEEKLDKDNETK